MLRWRELSNGPFPDSCRSERRGLALLDHSIRSGEQRRRDVEAQRFGGLAVDHKLEFRRLLYRKFVRFCAAQDLIDKSCRTLRACVRIGPITEEGTFLCPWPKAGCKQQLVLA